jgi:hypothetical protein
VRVRISDREGHQTSSPQQQGSVFQVRSQGTPCIRLPRGGAIHMQVIGMGDILAFGGGSKPGLLYVVTP